MTEYRIIDKPRIQREWNGRAVRLNRGAANSWGAVPAGAIGTIFGPYGANGFRFKTERCSCCGFQFTCSRVRKEDFDLVEPIPET